MKQFNTEIIGASAEKTYVAVTAGTVFASSDLITVSAAFDDEYQYVGVNGPKVNEKNFEQFSVGDAAIGGNGLQGKNNPKDADGGNPASTLTAPVGGAAFQLVTSKDVPEDGAYVYFFHKATSNKQYFVFEEGSAIPYTFTMITDGTNGFPQLLGYTLKEGTGPNGTLTLDDLPSGIQNVEAITEVTLEDASKHQNGCSVIKFKVYPDLTYLIGAAGSKMTAVGFYYDTTGDATINISNTELTWTLLDKGAIPGSTPTAISTVKAINSNESVIYNVAGQQVNKDYKGLVIKNGKKMIQK